MTKMGKNLTDVAYNINDDGDNDDDDEDDDDESVEAPDAPAGDEKYARSLSNQKGGVRQSSRLAKDAAAMQDAQEGVAERERRQIKLMERRNEERLRELARANRKKGNDDEKDQAEELEAYKRTRDYPDNILPNQVKVDMANQCVFLPICGNPVPFHISTIKNVVMPEGDSATLLRINFYTAGMAVGKDAPANMVKLVQKYAPYASFVRELTFRSLDGHNLTQVSNGCVVDLLYMKKISLYFRYLRPSVRFWNFEREFEQRNCGSKRKLTLLSKKSSFEQRTIGYPVLQMLLCAPSLLAVRLKVI